MFSDRCSAFCCLRFFLHLPSQMPDRALRQPLRLWKHVLRYLICALLPRSFPAPYAAASAGEEGYIQARLAFVEMDQAHLGHGFGSPLRRIASRFGSAPLEQVRNLCADSVQGATTWALRASAASSLQVERQSAETKRSEALRLCPVSTAGRHHIERQHLRQRRDQLQEAEQAAALWRRTLRQGVNTLAWERPAELARPKSDPPASASSGPLGSTRVH